MDRVTAMLRREKPFRDRKKYNSSKPIGYIVNPALGRRMKDQEFKVSLGYLRFCLLSG